MTHHYAAPEMFKNAVSKTSDQYSLEVSYVHLRTGKLPLTGSFHQIIYAHILLERNHIHVHSSPDRFIHFFRVQNSHWEPSVCPSSSYTTAERPLVAVYLARPPSTLNMETVRSVPGVFSRSMPQ